MAKYSQEQLKVIRTIRRRARARYPNNPAKRRRYEMAAYTIGRVESNFVNVNHGDADSVNWRQERASIYGGDMSIRRSVDRVFNEMEQYDRGQSIGELAADVQRPAAQYRGRYAQHLAEARRLAGKGVGALGGGGSATLRGQAGRIKSGQRPRLIPGSTTVDKRSALVDALLAGGSGSLIKRWQSNLASGQYTTTTPPRVVKGKGPKYQSLGNVKVRVASSGGKPRGKVNVSQINELFWNGPRPVNIDEGKRVGKGYVPGHTEHAHAAFKTRAQARRAAKLAVAMGLTVREYTPMDKVDPVHSKTSHHYEDGGYRAMDVSGARKAEWARRIARGQF